MKGERVKVGESHTLVREREIRAGAWRGKSKFHGKERQIPRRASKKSLHMGSRGKHEGVSGRKSSLGRSAEF